MPHPRVLMLHDHLGVIAHKANRLLQLLLIAMLLIVARIWYLTVIQHDQRAADALRQRTKLLIEPPERGTIRDRCNVLLAGNTIGYRATIIYSHLRQLPAKERRPHIQRLASLLATTLDLDAARIEDQIHSHAIFYGHIPFLIKDNLTEAQYYRLRIRERDYPGLATQRYPKRIYPHHRIASDIIGYIGPIPREQYRAIVDEMQQLTTLIRTIDLGLDTNLTFPEGITSYEAAKTRLTALQERAYTITDHVGRHGIERSLEQELRGTAGTKRYIADARGTHIRDIASQPAIPGKRIVLSLSIELQEYAEQLLAQSEQLRSSPHDPLWIRGGAIIALEPRTGEVIAMASYPRFDPNDLVAGHNQLRWLEGEALQAAVWDGKLPMQRERLVKGTLVDEERPLTWGEYLRRILPPDSQLHTLLSEQTPLAPLVQLQRAFDAVLQRAPLLSPPEVMALLYEQPNPLADDVAALKQQLDPFLKPLSSHRERLLCLDLTRCLFLQTDFPTSPDLTIGDWRGLTMSAAAHIERLRANCRRAFHTTLFAQWRRDQQPTFMKRKRLEERQQHKPTTPYLEYVDQEERRQFEAFWQRHRYRLLEQAQLPCELLPALRTYTDLTAPLYGSYPGMRLTKHLAGAWLHTSPGCLRSFAYRHAAAQGSIFKLLTAYTALKQLYDQQHTLTSADCHLFQITDRVWNHNGRTYVGTFADGTPIPQHYKGGRIPKSASSNIGAIDLLRAIETSSDPYFSILAGDYIRDPQALATTAAQFGYGAPTGIALPFETAGKLPTDLTTNRTSLYSFAIGQSAFTATPLQTACVMAALANNGDLLRPTLIKYLADRRTLQISSPTIRRHIDLPVPIHRTLIDGMRRVVQRLQHDDALARTYASAPSLYSDFRTLTTLIGKTSTSEALERTDLLSPPVIHNHTWFGGISYDTSGNPDLVVVVFLRHGSYGKEAAPLAAQIVRRWQAIRGS